MNKEFKTSDENSMGEAKAKMLAALALKKKGNSLAKNAGPASGSKIGAGQTGGSAPKMHRRKAGSA